MLSEPESSPPKDNWWPKVVPLPLYIQRLRPDATLPTRAYKGDAGFDLYVCEHRLILPDQFVDVPTGVAIEPPPGYWFRITGRSSTWRKLSCLVVEGVIDEGFRGELFVGVRNMGTAPVELQAGDRVAQMIPHRTIAASMDAIEVEDLAPSDRGQAGFGSTGR
jgi:dUTP pyrophosphatase